MHKSLSHRDYYFDNARAFLIYLVVFGHLLNPYVEGHKHMGALYLLIYSFHMPSFLFISGYFAKNIGKPDHLEKVAKKLLVPYFVFFSFFSVYYYLTGKSSHLQLDPFDPVFALWFLITLFIFHVVLVIVKNYKPYYVLPIAVIVSLLAGFSSNIDGYMSYSRTIVFFPIFYLGFLMNKHQAMLLRNKKLIPISLLILVGFYIVYMIHPINSDWLLGSSPYSSLDGPDVYSPLKRLLLYMIICATMFSFLNLVPSGLHWFTYVGQRTMYIYLLHGIAIGLIRGYKLYPFQDPITVWTYLYLIGLTALIVYLLSTNFVAKWTNPVINLKSPSKFKAKL